MNVPSHSNRGCGQGLEDGPYYEKGQSSKYNPGYFHNVGCIMPAKGYSPCPRLVLSHLIWNQSSSSSADDRDMV